MATLTRPPRPPECPATRKVYPEKCGSPAVKCLCGIERRRRRAVTTRSASNAEAGATDAKSRLPPVFEAVPGTATSLVWPLLETRLTLLPPIRQIILHCSEVRHYLTATAHLLRRFERTFESTDSLVRRAESVRIWRDIEASNWSLAKCCSERFCRKRRCAGESTKTGRVQGVAVTGPDQPGVSRSRAETTAGFIGSAVCRWPRDVAEARVFRESGRHRRVIHVSAVRLPSIGMQIGDGSWIGLVFGRSPLQCSASSMIVEVSREFQQPAFEIHGRPNQRAIQAFASNRADLAFHEGTVLILVTCSVPRLACHCANR